MNDPSEVLSGGLLRLLAGNFALLFKARYISWQQTAEKQGELRAIVRQDHRDLNDSIDALARMIISLGRAIPTGYCELISASSVSDQLRACTINEMIDEITRDHRQAVADIDFLSTVLPGNAQVSALLSQLRLCHLTSLESLAAAKAGVELSATH